MRLGRTGQIDRPIAASRSRGAGRERRERSPDWAPRGARIRVREVRIDGRRILVRLRVRGATDPFSLRTREISRHYALDGNNLVLLDESEAEVQSTPAENYVYLPVRIDIVAGSARSVAGSVAPGQIVSYVAHGRSGEDLDILVRRDLVYDDLS